MQLTAMCVQACRIGGCPHHDGQLLEDAPQLVDGGLNILQRLRPAGQVGVLRGSQRHLLLLVLLLLLILLLLLLQ